jgi:transposase-like protein
MKRHPKAFWVELVAELEAGATPADVARRHRVRETTLRWWRTQLRSASAGPRLLPVTASPVGRSTRHVEIAVGGAVVRVAEGTDVEYVGALVRALGAAC